MIKEKVFLGPLDKYRKFFGAHLSMNGPPKWVNHLRIGPKVSEFTNKQGKWAPNLGIYIKNGPSPKEMGGWPLRTNIYVRIISVLLLVTQETELCL